MLFTPQNVSDPGDQVKAWGRVPMTDPTLRSRLQRNSVGLGIGIGIAIGDRSKVDRDPEADSEADTNMMSRE